MSIEEKMLQRNFKGIAKGLEIYGFGFVEYSVMSESGCMVALRAQTYCVPGLSKDLCVISPQIICTSKGTKGNFIVHCHD